MAHPYAQKEEGRRIQGLIEKQTGLTIINPFTRDEQAIYDKKLAPGGGGLDENDCRDIVVMDLEKIDHTDGVVALLLDRGMIGTIMEIFYASAVKGRPVICYAPNKREQEHPWIRFYASAIAKTEGELIEAVLRARRRDDGLLGVA
jgi:nucleoside 2-deoxyribosyltransferase